MDAVAREALPADVVSRVRAGDQAAFEQLFRYWYATLADYASHIVRSADDAEDAVQDVFVSLWRRRTDLPDAEKLGAYLHRAVRNRALNQLRDAKAQVPLDDEIDLASDEPAPEAAVEHADLADAVATAINALAPRTREVFLLSREQELTYAQIAETLGISIKTVETLMGRALRTLRTTLRPRTRGA